MATSPTNTGSPVLDPSFPYYLHHSKNPGTLLVSTPLNGDNYLTWHHAMRMALHAKNKMMFVNRSLPKPIASLSEVQIWDRCNFMVLSWILNVLNCTIADSVLYVNTAHSVWKELEERYALLIFHLKRSISTIQQGNDSLVAYYTCLKMLWDELTSYVPIPACICGAQSALHSVNQQERVYQFLMGLFD
ncbi:uncharacterized protein LOC122070040 [Macadamia integrifolia]|uniref:uncharacterized protein LOC122070040 n=1 Tax=Macadamia integrifolia TaxID=60698 RepID=UPI001C4F120C|nr:uncharacterized protein LOC122070040 [Macadamia integrifolia]